MSRQSRETKFNPFWFYKLLVKPSRVAGEVIPELVMPSGDEVWSADDGQKMKWRDSWRSCWETLLKEFLPHAQSRSEVRYNKKHPQGFMSPTLMIAYEPSSGHDWLRSIDDSQMTKSHAQSLNDHNVLNYRFVNDVFGWALDCTLKYCRWRMGWGEWSKRKRGKYEDVADTYFFSRPRSQRACKFLVNWIVKFANARQQFYLHIDGKIRHPCHSQSRVCKSTKEIITHHKGRPAKLKMGKTPNEDLWLILIWPIAVQHGWTYKDVVRALRLHFGHDALKRPAPKPTLQQAGKGIANYFQLQQAEQPVNEYVPKAEAKWRREALRVIAGDAEKMRLRCKRLGLARLNPRHRDITAEPPFFSLVNGFYSTE